MKPTTLWIIRLALSVQFVGVLAVPAIVAANDEPRALWTAEWLRPHQGSARTLGLLELRNGKLSFTEQAGQATWQVDLADVKQVGVTNEGRALLVVTADGHEYAAVIMLASLTPQSPKRTVATIEKALRQRAGNSR